MNTLDAGKMKRPHPIRCGFQWRGMSEANA